MKNELLSLDASARSELVRSKQIKPSELLEACLARLDLVEEKLGCIASLDRDRAMQRAKKLDHIDNDTPFAGVPILLKDLIAYPQVPTMMGSRLFQGNIAQEATQYSKAIDDAGFVYLGKSTTSEMGLLGSTETVLHGITHNPWDSKISAGGSSGGAAASVAARISPIAHASDGGGSIRLPAALNGVFGFKPGRDRIVASGPADMNGLLVDHCVSISVRDSARYFACTTRDNQSKAVLEASKERLTIGVYSTTLMGREPRSRNQQALEKCAKLCEELGHQVKQVEAPPIDGAAISDAFFSLAGSQMLQLSEMMQAMLGRPLGEEDFEPFTLELIDWYRHLDSSALEVALANMKAQAQQMRNYLSSCDIFLCPTMPCDPYEIAHLAPDQGREKLLRRTEFIAGYTPIHNIAGVPAMSVPLYQGEDGLPLGMHFAAAEGGEDKLFALAYELEEAMPWAGRLPTLI